MYHELTSPLAAFYETAGCGASTARAPHRVHDHSSTIATLRLEWMSRSSAAVIVRKTPAEIDKMAAAGEIHSRAMRLVAESIREGLSTADLDQAVEAFIRAEGAVPTFKGFRGFAGSICASPNDMVVHGIPGPYRLKRGDILSVDIGVTLDGWVADGACTFPVGPVTPVAASLLEVTQASLMDAVEQCRPGNRVGDIGHAVQQRVEGAGFSVVRSLVGHGVGRDMHEDPQIPNYGDRAAGPSCRRAWCWPWSR